MIKADIKYRFGEKLREVRERKHATLKDVARSAGISESLVSQIERNKVSPSVDTLMAIASALSIDPEYLFREYKSNRDAIVVRKKDRNSHFIDEVEYQQLSLIEGDSDEQGIETFRITIKPDGEKGDMEFGHPGYETGIILQGSGELKYGTEVYKLFEGDTISFSSAIPHLLKNSGNKILKAIWVISPPRLFTRR